jgi:hypothetical protein
MKFSDTIKQRHMQQVSDEKRWAKMDAARAIFTVQDNLHPAIGSLMTSKGVKYYAHVNGVYHEGSPENLALLLK